jgi:hypothetical protein
MIKISFFILLSIFTVTQAFALGLGSTFTDIENHWNKGYREQFSIGTVQVGENQHHYIEYMSIDFFGAPKRATHLGGPACGLFPGTINNPSAIQFFKKIKSLIPYDSKLISSFKRNSNYLSETYNFRSSSLAGMKSIKNASAYQTEFGIKGDPIGTFQVIVNYEMGRSDRVLHYTIALGLDHSDSGRITKNPFK